MLQDVQNVSQVACDLAQRASLESFLKNQYFKLNEQSLSNSLLSNKQQRQYIQQSD